MTALGFKLLKMRAYSASTAFQMARARADFNDSEPLRDHMADLAYKAMKLRIELQNACIATCPLLGGAGLEV